MDATARQFGADARTLLRVASIVQSIVPAAARPWAARVLGQRFSPYLAQRKRVVASMQKALGLSMVQADTAWHEWLGSHGLFALTAVDYGHLSLRWIQREVSIADPTLLQQIVQHGGFVLSCHSFHHNTLGCIFGLAGGHSSMLVASARSSPYFAQIGPFIERLNSGSATHFGGGSYLFTDDPSGALAQTDALLAQGKIVISLCDVPRAVGLEGGADLASAQLLSKTICPHAGALDLAVKRGVPIYAAVLYPQQGRLVLQLQRLQDIRSTASALQQYFDFLARALRAAPACWQGWDWYDTLPDLAPNKSAATHNPR